MSQYVDIVVSRLNLKGMYIDRASQVAFRSKSNPRKKVNPQNVMLYISVKLSDSYAAIVTTF